MRSFGLFLFIISPHRSQLYHRRLCRLVTFSGLGPSSRLDDYKSGLPHASCKVKGKPIVARYTRALSGESEEKM